MKNKQKKRKDLNGKFMIYIQDPTEVMPFESAGDLY